MVSSMTGFASLTHEDEIAVVDVTVRSVNHRYLDIKVRMPQLLTDIEEQVRDRIKRHVLRGHVELAIGLRVKSQPVIDLDINDALISALVKLIERPDVASATEGRWTIGDLLRFPQVVTARERSLGDDVTQHIASTALETTESVLLGLEQMRNREGEFLLADLSERHQVLSGLVVEMAKAAESGQGALKDRLLARLAELPSEIRLDAISLNQEVVRWVAKSDIHEEIARLDAHLQHWTELIVGLGHCGRRLDFLLQEMNREVNTIGSKVDGIDVTSLVLSAKAELEKMREQIQNVE